MLCAGENFDSGEDRIELLPENFAISLGEFAAICTCFGASGSACNIQNMHAR